MDIMERTGNERPSTDDGVDSSKELANESQREHLRKLSDPIIIKDGEGRSKIDHTTTVAGTFAAAMIIDSLMKGNAVNIPSLGITITKDDLIDPFEEEQQESGVDHRNQPR